MRNRFDAATIAACQMLVAALDARACATGAYELEREWVAPDGNPVHAVTLRPDDISAGFLADLPRHAHFFTGWPPEGGTLNCAGRVLWRTLGRIAPELGHRVLRRWWHRLQSAPGYYAGPPREAALALAERHARRLPLELRPAEDFDGTDLDRLALSERLLAMERLGVFRFLAGIEKPVVLEIGAGYGMLAAALLRVFPAASYTIVDLPTSLMLSGCYLRSRMASRSMVSLVLSADLPELEGTPIDLAVNTLSFGEMGDATVDAYAAFLRRNLKPTGILFEQNFAHRQFAQPNFCDPGAILGRHLRLTAESRLGLYLKGVPRLWATS